MARLCIGVRYDDAAGASCRPGAAIEGRCSPAAPRRPAEQFLRLPARDRSQIASAPAWADSAGIRLKGVTTRRKGRRRIGWAINRSRDAGADDQMRHAGSGCAPRTRKNFLRAFLTTVRDTAHIARGHRLWTTPARRLLLTPTICWRARQHDRQPRRRCLGDSKAEGCGCGATARVFSLMRDAGVIAAGAAAHRASRRLLSSRAEPAPRQEIPRSPSSPIGVLIQTPCCSPTGETPLILCRRSF
jgi:hypothetical protein